MTLKDKLPDRLKCSPLLTMESDSDIETIAESIVNLSDSDGDFFKKTEKLLLMAALGYLRDWCEPSALSRCDGLTPRDSNGIDVSEDFSLTCYEGFRHAATRETRTSIVTTLLLVLEEVEKEDAYGK